MNRNLGQFKKTDHFIYRQWDRGVADKLLISILNSVDASRRNTLIIVSRRALKKVGLKLKKELFIKIDKKTLITCFYSDFQDYLNSTRKQEYFIINQI